ncbi:MAG: helix-turn-helix transcriptional regulator, partial [Carnobacterium sp.]
MEQWFEKGKKEISKAEYDEIKELVRAIFSKTLKELRKASGLTLKELADLSGTSDSYLSQLENGRRNPPKIDLLSNIARGLTSTPYTIKGSPKTRSILAEYSKTYSELFKSAGYNIKDTGLLEKEKSENTNGFLISYKNI